MPRPGNHAGAWQRVQPVVGVSTGTASAGLWWSAGRPYGNGRT